MARSRLCSECPRTASVGSLPTTWSSPSLPKGSLIECTAHYDNSVNNKYNPDATKEVRHGEQSWDEMMIGFFNVAFDAKIDPKSGD